MQTRNELDSTARRVAKERGYDVSDYREVLRRLKKDAIANDALMPTYRARLKDIEAIVRRERIVTMPEREAVIRVATEAESTAIPAPHLSPPRLIGNTGEPAEFVLPLENPNAPPGTKMDDFTFDAITWTLTAHEARPGPRAAVREDGGERRLDPARGVRLQQRQRRRLGAVCRGRHEAVPADAKVRWAACRCG